MSRPKHIPIGVLIVQYVLRGIFIAAAIILALILCGVLE